MYSIVAPLNKKVKPFPTNENVQFLLDIVLLFCAKDQDRTGDPSLFRGMLYQLSYPSNLFWQFTKIIDQTLNGTGWKVAVYAGDGCKQVDDFY